MPFYQAGGDRSRKFLLLLCRFHGYHPSMMILLPALAVAFAAFCVWLTVRIVNRRERWAKWTLAIVIGLPTLYVASFGPACWYAGDNETTIAAIFDVYYPILWSARAMRRERSPGEFENSRLDSYIIWYSTIGRDDGAYPELHSGGGKEWAVPEPRPW